MKRRGRWNIEDAQQQEVLQRLAETDANPAILEAFEETDLERIIRQAVRRKRANAR